MKIIISKKIKDFLFYLLCINFLTLLFPDSVLAGEYRCLFQNTWYTCDYGFSGKYMTIYRDDGKKFTIYRDVYKDYSKWYLTKGDNVLGAEKGHYVSISLNQTNAIRLFSKSGEEVAILEYPLKKE